MAGPYYSDSNAKSATDTTTLRENLGERYQGKLDTERLLVSSKTYTMLGTEAAGEIVRMVKLTKGDTVLPRSSIVYITVDLAATLTLDIGDTDALAPSPLVDSDADRYADGIAGAAVGAIALTGGAALTVPYTLNEDAWITVTLVGLSTPIAGGKFTLELFYKRGV